MSGKWLKAGDAGGNGASISASMWSTSSTPIDRLCCANCSQDKIDPRSLPAPRPLGRKKPEFSDPGGPGEIYDRLARVGRVKGDSRGGVWGFCPPLKAFVRNRGITGVGAPGEAMDESMNSTSLASILSMLLSAVKMTGGGTGAGSFCFERVGDGLSFRGWALRADMAARGDSGGPRNGLLLTRVEPPAFRLVGVEGDWGARDELDDDADEGGRVEAALLAEEDVVTADLVTRDRVGDSRVGESCREGAARDMVDAVFDFFSGVAGWTFMAAVRFTCRALR